jgi:hypothetical protein
LPTLRYLANDAALVEKLASPARPHGERDAFRSTGFFNTPLISR